MNDACLAFLTLRLFRAASAPIIVCTAVIKFFISCILWGEIEVLLLLLLRQTDSVETFLAAHVS